MSEGHPEVRVAVVATDDGDALQVGVPGAAQGTKVRFSGTEQVLEAGSVSFPLSASSLQLGVNHVTLDIVEPDGDVDSAEAELHVFGDERPLPAHAVHRNDEAPW